MEVFLLDPDEYCRLYNCSMYSVDSIPLAKRQHRLLGQIFIFAFVSFETMYIPCLFAIGKHLDQSCYKIMFYIGIVDVACLWINGFFTGFFAIAGYVFCSDPELIYLLGVGGLTCWIAESTSAILLAINRCLEMWSSDLCRRAFAGNRTWAWLAIPTLCAACFAVWTKPIAFSGLYLSWFFNPHAGYIDDASAVYENLPHSVHNLIVLFALTGIYVVFSVGFYVRTRTFDPTQRRASPQRMIFIQVLLISFFNATGSAIYAYMQYVHLNEALIIIAQFCWLFAHGLPSVVYLTMNRTVRGEVRQMLALLTFKSQISNTETTAFAGIEANRSVSNGINPT